MIEAQAVQTGKNPKEIRYKNAEETQVAKLLTILVEFNPNANDDFTGTMVPQAVFDDPLTPQNERDCVQGGITNGPLHNNIPNPADASHKDNNSMWVPDFSPEFYNEMLYTTTGIQQRVRPDLKGPDGKKGIDLRGYTMHNMYLEMSKGAYTVDGQATPWVQVPHSEAWYGQDTCLLVNGVWVAGASQDDNGHPDNPAGAGPARRRTRSTSWRAPTRTSRGPTTTSRTSPTRMATATSTSPTASSTTWCSSTPARTPPAAAACRAPQAIWAHSSAIIPGHTIPGTDIMISNYIVQPEDSGVGVFAHEYGHDLGLPDLYDIGSGGDSDVDFWDLMASGSHTGPVFQGIPTHMGLWDKFVLGWADPLILDPGDPAQTVKVGQTSRTPVGTEDGIRVNLPTKVVTLSHPHSGAGQWWSNNDQSWADVRLTRTISVPAGSRHQVLDVEQLQHRGGLGLRLRRGLDRRWRHVGRAEDLQRGQRRGLHPGRLRRPERPHARLRCGRRSGQEVRADRQQPAAYERNYVNLAPFAGQTIQLRLRYATDAGARAGRLVRRRLRAHGRRH